MRTRTRFWNQHLTEQIKPGHAEEGYEGQDLTARAVYAFLISLIVGGVIVYFIVPRLYHFTDARQRRLQPQQIPLVQHVDADPRIEQPDEIKEFPEPR